MVLKIKCEWCLVNQVMIDYHDKEWGVPLYDDKKFFEFLVLDAFQAGLSWNIVLQKRQGFAKAFANFDYKKVAKFDDKKIATLIADKNIIRNKLKIKATITNAQQFILVQKEYGSFAKYIWQFTNYQTKVNKIKNMKQIPASSRESDNMSKDLKKRGFKFVGTTICYAFMQAAGMINDHKIDCWRYAPINKLKNNRNFS